MDASEVFKAILQNIESSGLNYSLSKTPFSASISLKCSFILRRQGVCISENFSTKSVQHDAIVQELEAENLELRAEVDTLKDIHDSEQKKLLEEIAKQQNVFDHEKQESRATEKNVAEFREELLKIKKEKHDLSDNLKMKVEECEKYKTKVGAINATNDALEKVIKNKNDSVELRNEELSSAKRDYKSVYENLIATQSELDNLKLERIKDLKVYKCEYCDFMAETYAKLKVHNRQNHCQSKVTQYEKNSIFQKYDCFYCEKTLHSTSDLAAHPTDCHYQFSILLESQAPLQTCEDVSCDMCSRIFDEKDIENHMKVDHLESDVFWCDICPLYFQSNCDLQFHIRGCHWDQM